MLPRLVGVGIDQVDCDFAPDLPNVLGAESEVRDAMTNLMLNAVDALPDGGVITLRSRHNTRDSEVVIEIEDNGVGMTETVRSRCLEPFFTTKGECGTGLGLTMVFGMMPLALALGEGASQRAPMAHAVIGGLISSTLLTLVVVPVVLVYIDRVGLWTKKRFSRSADELASRHKPAE